MNHENENEYVQHRNGNVYIGKTRVTLDTIVRFWRMGQTPEQIHEDFPTVSLAAIYGTVAYYLDHREEVDHYLREIDEKWRVERAKAEAADPEFYANMRKRLAEARVRLGMPPREPDSPAVEEHEAESLRI
ncbi:MAG: hypothetical protein OJF49_001695 [Ktedonobacterales bacterium]|jgi:uncharacterized protein (DUF433 family)|nr:MAG: hypothetical protein OJF49_001695 [Ktedonobacterales bacterium]